MKAAGSVESASSPRGRVMRRSVVPPGDEPPAGSKLLNNSAASTALPRNSTLASKSARARVEGTAGTGFGAGLSKEHEVGRNAKRSTLNAMRSKAIQKENKYSDNVIR